MKRFLFASIIVMITMFSISATVGAQNYSGLWVGNATLKYVSEVNKQYSDLSFDLGLMGLKAHDTLISKVSGSGIWTKIFDVNLPNNVANPSDYYSNMKVRLWGDGKIVLKLNSEEILRYNLPTGSDPHEFTLPVTLLKKTGNVLETQDSHTPSFDLELTATLVDQKSTPLIAMETAGWKYDDTGIAPGTTWMTLGYNDTGWSTGQGQFGYGENDEQTTVSDTSSTVYFRKTFSGNIPAPGSTGTTGDNASPAYAEIRVPGGNNDLKFTADSPGTLYNNVTVEFVNGADLVASFSGSTLTITVEPGVTTANDVVGFDYAGASVPFTAGLLTTDDVSGTNNGDGVINTDFTHLRVLLLRDDGAVVYVNGDEILRSNMPSGTIPGSTGTTGDNANPAYAEIKVPGGNNDLKFTAESAESAGTSYNNVTVEFVNGANFAASYANSTSTLTITVKPGVTTANELINHFNILTNVPFTAALLTPDDVSGTTNDGNGIISAFGHGWAPLKALGSTDEGRYIVVDVDVPALNPGIDTNVLAVELHQHPAELGGSTGTGSGALTRTPATFDLRLMFHVDSSGAVKLLKEVIQMYDSASATPGYVLLTNHEDVSAYQGVAVRDGESVGRRLSAVGFDFQGTHLACAGGVSPSGAVDCTISLPSAHPTNPFLHRYHPDHDNLDERYENAAVEAYEVTRTITLNFSDRYPPDEDLPLRAVKPAGWGDFLLGGTYTEIIKGLHKYTNGIKVSGPFTLRRVVTTDNLK